MACYETRYRYVPGAGMTPYQVEVPCPEAKKPKGGGGGGRGSGSKTNKYGGQAGTKHDKYGNPYSVHKGRDVGGYLGGGSASSKRTGRTGGAGSDASARRAQNEAFLRKREQEIARRRAAAEAKMRERVQKAAERRQAQVARAEARRAAAQAQLDAAKERVKAARSVAEVTAASAQQRIAEQKLREAETDKKSAEREARARAATAILEQQERNAFAKKKSDKRPDEERWTRAERLRNRRKRRKRITETKNKPPLIPKSKVQRGEVGYGKVLRTRIRTEIALQKQNPELFDPARLDDLGNELVLHQQLMRDQWRERSQSINRTGKAIKADLEAGNTKAARRKYKKYLELTDGTDLAKIQSEFERLFGKEASTVKGRFKAKGFKMSLTTEFALGVNEVWDAHVAHVEDKLYGTGIGGFMNKARQHISWTGAKVLVWSQANATRKEIIDPIDGTKRQQTVSERLVEMAETGELDRFGQTQAGSEATANFQTRALNNKNDPELGPLYRRLIDAGIETNADISNNSTTATLVRRQIVPEALNEAWEEFQNSPRYQIPGVAQGLFDPANYGRDEEGEFFIDSNGEVLRHGDELEGGGVPHWGTGNDLIGDFFGLTGPPRQQELDRHFNNAKTTYDESQKQRIEDRLWAEVGQEDPGLIGDLMRTPVVGEIVTGFDTAFGLTSHEVRKQTLTEYGASLGTDELNPKLAQHLGRAASDVKPGPDFPGQDVLQGILGIPIRTLETAAGALDEATGNTGIPKIVYNMVDLAGKGVTFPANMIVFPLAETGGRMARGDEIIKEYADKDEEGLVTAAFAFAGWAGVGATTSKVVDEDGEGIRYDVTFEAGGIPISFSFGKGENVENRIEDESKRIEEAWGTGDWGVFLETVSTEGEFFKRGNLAGALNLVSYLIFDPTNWIAPLTLAKRGLGGVRAAAAAGQKVDSRLLSLAQKAKAFGEGFGTNPNHAEALGASKELLEKITGTNEEDSLEFLQRTLLQMDEGDDAVSAMQKVMDEMGLSRDLVDVNQLHQWAELYIRDIMRHKGWIVHTQTDRALQAFRRAKIEGGGNYHKIKSEQRKIRREFEAVQEARKELDKVRKIEAKEAARRAERAERAKGRRLRIQRGQARQVEGPKKVKITKKTTTQRKRVRRQIRTQQQRTDEALNRNVPAPESARPQPIRIIDNSLERSELKPKRTFATEAERQKHLASPQATFRELSDSIAEDIDELTRIDRAQRAGRVPADKAERVTARQKRLQKRVYSRQQRLQKMRHNADVHAQQRAATTPPKVQKARMSYKKRRELLERRLAEWKKDLDRFEDLRKKGKLKAADTIIEAHHRQRDIMLAEFKAGNDYVPKRAKILRGQKPAAASEQVDKITGRAKVSKETNSIEETYDTLFSQKGDDLYGSKKPKTREIEDALTREQRIKRIERSQDEGAYGVPGQATIYWHPDNGAINSDYANMLRGTIEDTRLSYRLRMAAFIQLQSYAKRTNAPIISAGNLDGSIGAYDRSLAGVGDNIQRQAKARHDIAIAEALVRSRRTKKAPTSSRLVMDENGDLVPYIQKGDNARPERGSLDEIYDDVNEVGNLGDDLEPFIGKNEIYDFYSPMKPWDPSHPMATQNSLLHRLQEKIGKPEWRRKVNGARLTQILDQTRAAYADAQSARLQRMIDDVVNKLEDFDKQINELLELRKNLTRQDLPEKRRIDVRIDALRQKQTELMESTQPKIDAAQAALKKVEAGQLDAIQGGIKEYKDAMQPLYDLFHKLSRDGELATRQLENAHDQMVKRAFEVLPDGKVKIHWEEEGALTWLLMESRWGHDFALAPDVIEGVMWEFFTRRGMLPGHAMAMFNPTYKFRATARFTQFKPRFDTLYSSSRQWLANRLPRWDGTIAGNNLMGNAYHNFNRFFNKALTDGKKVSFERITRTVSGLLDGQIEHWQNWVPQKGQAGYEAARTTGVNSMRAAVLDNGIDGWVARNLEIKDGVLRPKSEAAKVEVRAVYDRYIDLRTKTLMRDEGLSLEDAAAKAGRETPQRFLANLTGNYQAIRAQGGLGRSKVYDGYGAGGKKKRAVFSSYGQVPPGFAGVHFELRTAYEMAWGAGEVVSANPLEEMMMFMARSQFWDDVNIGMSQRFVDRMTAWGYADEVRDFMREWHAPEFYGLKAEITRHGDQNIALQNILVNDKLQTPLGKLFLDVEGEEVVLALKNAGRETEARRLADELAEASRASQDRAAMLEQEDLYNVGRPDYANPQELADTLADVHLKLTKGTLSERSGAIRTLKRMLVEIEPGSVGWRDVKKLIDEIKEDESLSARVREALVEEFDPVIDIRATPVSGPRLQIIDDVKWIGNPADEKPAQVALSRPARTPKQGVSSDIAPTASSSARGLTTPETVRATPDPAAVRAAPEEFEDVTEYTVESVQTFRSEPGPPVVVQYTIEPDPRVIDEVTSKAFANIMDMSEEDFLAMLQKRNNRLLRSRRVSPDEKVNIRQQNRQIKDVQNHIAKIKANGMYTTPRRAFARAHRAAYALRDRMEGVIPPRQIAYYAENADQADTETARAINNKLQNSYVKGGEGIDPRVAEAVDIEDYELLDMLVTAEVRRVQHRRTSSLGLNPLDGENLDKQVEMLLTKRDYDPRIQEAKKIAMREYYRRTGKKMDVNTYDRMRTVLAPHMTRRGRTLNLIMEAELASRKNGTTYYEEFIRLRKQKADINARRNVGWTLYENPHMTPDEAADLVSLTWFNDGTIRHAPTEITEFDEIILKKMFAHLTGGADITDEAQRVKALNAHGTTPPMDRRYRFRSHQERQGTWSPRAVETVIQRGAWSVDQERKWWMHNYGQMPAWLGDIIDDPDTFLTREGYYRAMKGSGNFNDNIVRDRILSGEERVSYEDLSWGTYDSNGNNIIKPKKDIEVERQYAFERYGSRVATQDPATGQIKFHSMPWLMNVEEYRQFRKAQPDLGVLDNMVPYESIDAVEEAIAKVTEKHIDLYMASHWSAGVAEIDPAMVHNIAFELVRELATTVPWRGTVRNLRNRQLLDTWASIWRASIISNPAFVLSNMLDTPTKGILFSITDDMLGTTRPEAVEAISGLGDIGRGQGSALLYSRGARSFSERINPRTTYGRVDQATALWDGATTALARNTLQPIEDAVKLRLARQYYTYLRFGKEKPDGFLTRLTRGKRPDETVWDALIRNGATEQQADLILKIQVQKKIDKLFPTLESAGLGERILNKVFPFISYNVKNKIVWVSWALDHPMMVRTFIAMQESIFEHNKNEFMKEHGLTEDDYLPEHLFHQIRIGDLYLDISNFTDAARGLRPLVDPGGSNADLAGFIENVFRPLPSQRAALSVLLWNGFGIGGRVLWDREFDEDGVWTGGYVKRIAPPLTPWGRDINDLAQYVWPIDLAQTLSKYVEDGDLSDGEVVKIFGDILLFSGFSEPSENYMLNMQYRKLFEVDEAAAQAWLQNTPSGKRLQELWAQSFFEGSTTKLDEFTLVGKDENGIINRIPTPEQIRKVWLVNQEPELRQKMFDDWNLITEIQEGFDVAIDGQTDPKVIDEMWTARRTAIAQIYGQNPMLGFYEGMGKDSEEFDMYEQDFIIDQKQKQFFSIFGAAQVPDDPAEAEQFYKDREQWLRDNPDVTQRLWEEANNVERTEQTIVEDYKHFFRADMLEEALAPAFEARDWQKGDDALRAAKSFTGLAFDFQGLAKDEDGRWQLIEKNIIGRIRGGEAGALYGLQMKAAWDKSGGDIYKWWQTVDQQEDLKQGYFKRNPEKRATWKQDGKYYAFWGRFGRLADKGRWDAAWDSWDNAPAWIRERMQESNPKKFRELERSSRYSTFMGTWVGLFEAGKPQQAMEYFWSLPQWARDRYFESHPGKSFGTSGATSGRGVAYVSTLNKMFAQIDAGNWDAAERIWNAAPAWMRRRYYANNPDSTLFRGQRGGSGGSGGGISDAKYKQYVNMMGKWVDLQRAGKDKEADAYFRSLPKWAQDFYLARHPDKALLKEDMRMQTLLMEFFGANKATQEAMKKNNPELMKWLNENSTAAARKNALLFLYSKLPDDPWLKRVFREKYPDVFSKEAKGKASTDKVMDTLAKHPQFTKAWMKWYKDIHETLIEAMKYAQAEPKKWEIDRKKRFPGHADSMSAEEVSTRKVGAALRQVREVNKRLPRIE